MKKCFLLLILFCCFWQINAQQLVVSGTTTFDGTAPAPGVEILIEIPPLNPATPGYTNYTVTDDLGHYADTIAQNAPSQGEVFVTMFDCDGSAQTQTFFWSPNVTDIEANFIFCENILPGDCWVEIVPDSTANGLVLTALPNGEAPFTFEWNTGDTSQTIPYVPNGQIYCVVITDATGCVSENCFFPWNVDCSVEIEIDSAANGLVLTALPDGEAPFTFEWSTGDTTQSIPYDPNSFEEYCVWVTDATGCMSDNCFFPWNNDCGVWLWYDYQPSGVPTIYAEAWGVPPFTYQWSTGETTETITPTASGDYCLTITDAEGCVSQSCIYVDITPIDCWVEIVLDSAANGLVLAALPEGEAPFTFEWSTGDTTQTIPYAPNGQVYCVVVTDATGCVSENCFFWWNPDCSVEIFLDSTAAGGLVLVAEPSGQGTFTYEWSTGDTTQTIPYDPNSFEEYCVWVTDAAGCVAENCFFPWNNDCGVSLWYDCPLGSVPTIYAEAWGAPPFTYQWSTGEVTETINPTDSGEYCVTVTDAEDCVSESCIWVDVLPFDSCGVDIVLVQNGDWLYAEAWGVAPFTYLWSNGESGSSIQIDPNISDYCVTVTDAAGCVSEACFFITGVDCGVAFQVDTIPGTNLYEITVIPSGVAPFTVFWDGINSNEFTITADLPGTYCVTIEDATGCLATGCVTVGGGAGCDVSIVEVADSSNVTILWAEVYAGNPNSIIEYQWSTGENSPVIVVTQPGDYCVTITTSDGCVAEDCLNVPLTPNSDISGWVYVEDSLQVPVGMFGDVYLYRMDPNAGSPELVAQTPFLPFPFGYQYIFEDQPAGQYLVRAVLAPDSPGFDDYLPTYYGDTELWSEAAIIELPALGWNSYDIFLVPSEKLNGPGSISGLVLEGDGLLGSDDRGDGDPVEGVSVFLYDANDLPAGTSWTDQTGAFRFESLPWGTYKVLVEITGKSNAYYMVTIGPDQPQVTDLIFEINGNDATTDLEEKVAGSEISVFPNPVSTEIQVVMQVMAPFDARFTITDVTGKVVFEQKQSLYPGKELLRFDVSHLPDGVFFLNVVSGKDILTKKIVKH